MTEAEPVTIIDNGDDVTVRCNRCGTHERFAYTPTTDLLSGIERFVNAHADCH